MIERKLVEMKRVLVLVIACTLVVCSIAGCGEGNNDANRRIGLYVVETIDTRVNQEFTISREFDLNSGYLWREDYDDSMLELVDTAVEANEEGEQGNKTIVLSQVFRFKALKKGKTEILLVYRRATLEGPMIAQQEIIAVNIK